jgi:hypothetical protein
MLPEEWPVRLLLTGWVIVAAAGAVSWDERSHRPWGRLVALLGLGLWLGASPSPNLESSWPLALW